MLPPGNERYPPTLCDDKIKAPSKFRWLNSCPVVYTDGTKIHTASAARFYSNVTFNRDGRYAHLVLLNHTKNRSDLSAASAASAHSFSAIL